MNDDRTSEEARKNTIFKWIRLQRRKSYFFFLRLQMCIFLIWRQYYYIFTMAHFSRLGASIVFLFSSTYDRIFFGRYVNFLSIILKMRIIFLFCFIMRGSDNCRHCLSFSILSRAHGLEKKSLFFRHSSLNHYLVLVVIFFFGRILLPLVFIRSPETHLKSVHHN